MDKPKPPKTITTRMLGTGPEVEFVLLTDAIAHGEAMAAWGAAQYKADAERLQWAHDNLQFDGERYWLPDVCIRESLGPEPTIDDTRAAIDKARGK